MERPQAQRLCDRVAHNTTLQHRPRRACAAMPSSTLLTLPPLTVYLALPFASSSKDAGQGRLQSDCIPSPVTTRSSSRSLRWNQNPGAGELISAQLSGLSVGLSTWYLECVVIQVAMSPFDRKPVASKHCGELVQVTEAVLILHSVSDRESAGAARRHKRSNNVCEKRQQERAEGNLTHGMNRTTKVKETIEETPSTSPSCYMSCIFCTLEYLPLCTPFGLSTHTACYYYASL